MASWRFIKHSPVPFRSKWVAKVMQIVEISKFAGIRIVNSGLRRDCPWIDNLS